MKRIKEFRGFGPKLGNFLIRTFIDILDLNFTDISDIFQPVDIHDVRLSHDWGLIESKNMSKDIIDKVKKFGTKLARKQKLTG